jgi:beta-lactamase class A
MPDEPKTETLRQECERILSESKAISYAVAVHDYETGLSLGLNADRRFHAASTMKVAILLAIAKGIDDKRIRPNDTLHVRNRFRSAIDRTPFKSTRNRTVTRSSIS